MIEVINPHDDAEDLCHASCSGGGAVDMIGDLFTVGFLACCEDRSQFLTNPTEVKIRLTIKETKRRLAYTFECSPGPSAQSSSQIAECI